eukprot:CAMPEP_0113826500 /NCGR_PEP_ID=MMETSP0328-20130328/4291_1 /TAXON_ID=39455 /ORGANISM="Alexandrium minutum" /LENGTH=156 /DNA_ID=CAMNT_0000794475 /DNA_START=183 /DNA_END=651 /DNA_ORIENTATION=- /assembly_acc=CAM_ASM_000350
MTAAPSDSVWMPLCEKPSSLQCIQLSNTPDPAVAVHHGPSHASARVSGFAARVRDAARKLDPEAVQVATVASARHGRAAAAAAKREDRRGAVGTCIHVVPRSRRSSTASRRPCAPPRAASSSPRARRRRIVLRSTPPRKRALTVAVVSVDSRTSTR